MLRAPPKHTQSLERRAKLEETILSVEGEAALTADFARSEAAEEGATAHAKLAARRRVAAAKKEAKTGRASRETELSVLAIEVHADQVEVVAATSSVHRRLEARKEKQRRELDALFAKIDVDGSGSITREELHAALPNVDTSALHGLIAEVDKNGDGIFSHDEVKAFFPSLKKLMLEETIHTVEDEAAASADHARADVAVEGSAAHAKLAKRRRAAAVAKKKQKKKLKVRAAKAAKGGKLTSAAKKVRNAERLAAKRGGKKAASGAKAESKKGKLTAATKKVRIAERLAAKKGKRKGSTKRGSQAYPLHFNVRVPRTVYRKPSLDAAVIPHVSLCARDGAADASMALTVVMKKMGPMLIAEQQCHWLRLGRSSDVAQNALAGKWILDKDLTDGSVVATAVRGSAAAARAEMKAAAELIKKTSAVARAKALDTALEHERDLLASGTGVDSGASFVTKLMRGMIKARTIAAFAPRVEEALHASAEKLSSAEREALTAALRTLQVAHENKLEDELGMQAGQNDHEMARLDAQLARLRRAEAAGVEMTELADAKGELLARLSSEHATLASHDARRKAIAKAKSRAKAKRQRALRKKRLLMMFPDMVDVTKPVRRTHREIVKAHEEGHSQAFHHAPAPAPSKSPGRKYGFRHGGGFGDDAGEERAAATRARAKYAQRIEAETAAAAERERNNDVTLEEAIAVLEKVTTDGGLSGAFLPAIMILLGVLSLSLLSLSLGSNSSLLSFLLSLLSPRCVVADWTRRRRREPPLVHHLLASLCERSPSGPWPRRAGNTHGEDRGAHPSVAGGVFNTNEEVSGKSSSSSMLRKYGRRLRLSLSARSVGAAAGSLCQQ